MIQSDLHNYLSENGKRKEKDKNKKQKKKTFAL